MVLMVVGCVLVRMFWVVFECVVFGISLNV